MPPNHGAPINSRQIDSPEHEDVEQVEEEEEEEEEDLRSPSNPPSIRIPSRPHTIRGTSTTTPYESEEYQKRRIFLARRSTAPQNFTLRAVGVGLGIGTVICFSNTYFGLQTGWVSTMSMPSALVGFAVFRSTAKLITFKLPFTPVENVLVQTVAAAAGTMPLGCGFVGVVPAMEYLLDNDEGGRIRLGLGRLIIWAVGICFFGVVFAVPLRQQVIIREKLKFPSGTAAAHMIALLHNDEEVTSIMENSNSSTGAGPTSQHQPESDGPSDGLRARHTRRHHHTDSLHDGFGTTGTTSSNNSEDSSPSNPNSPSAQSHVSELSSLLSPASSAASDADWILKIRLLGISFTISATYTLLSYFFPILHNVPILGRGLASNWLWSLNPSPAYIGQGIIMGPETTIHMLMGAVLGWAVLSPLAKARGWAPGPVSDWTTGSKGWIVWVSLAIMLADSILNLGWVVIQQVSELVAPYAGDDIVELRDRTSRRLREWIPLFGKLFPPQQYSEPGYTPLLSTAFWPSSGTTTRNPSFNHPLPPQPPLPEPDCPPSALVSNTTTIISLVLSIGLCLGTIHLVFPNIVPFPLSFLSLFLALLLSIMGVRAMGETDLNPVSGISKLSQLLISLFTRGSPHAVVVNLIAGALSEAGALQAGELMQDLKTGYLLGASPKAQFYGQIIGSGLGAVIAAVVYKLYTHVYTIPGGLFEIPTAYVWVFTARLVTGDGLPPMADIFCLAFGILFGIATVARIYASNTAGDGPWWKSYVPGGIAFAIGMYNVPSFTLARTVGGLLDWYWSRPSQTVRSRMDETERQTDNHDPERAITNNDDANKGTEGRNRSVLVVIASGLILGEGLVSIVNLCLASMKVPHF